MPGSSLIMGEGRNLRKKCEWTQSWRTLQAIKDLHLKSHGSLKQRDRERDVIILHFTLKLEEGTRSNGCREPWEAGKDRVPDSL